MQVSEYPHQMPMAISTTGATFLSSLQNGLFFLLLLSALPLSHLLQWPLSQGKRFVLVRPLSPWCLALCPTATEVPGTFSVSGSNRHMRDLQAAFESPPRVSPKYLTLHPRLSILRSVWQIPRLEERVVYYSRHSKRASEIPNPDAR